MDCINYKLSNVPFETSSNVNNVKQKTVAGPKALLRSKLNQLVLLPFGHVVAYSHYLLNSPRMELCPSAFTITSLSFTLVAH